MGNEVSTVTNTIPGMGLINAAVEGRSVRPTDVTGTLMPGGKAAGQAVAGQQITPGSFIPNVPILQGAPGRLLDNALGQAEQTARQVVGDAEATTMAVTNVAHDAVRYTSTDIRNTAPGMAQLASDVVTGKMIDDVLTTRGETETVETVKPVKKAGKVEKVEPKQEQDYTPLYIVAGVALVAVVIM